METNAQQLTAGMQVAVQALAGTGALNSIGRVVVSAARSSAYSHGGEFWRDIGDSVSYSVEGDSVIVGASHKAARHKQFGGEIRARRALFLTIPLAAGKAAGGTAASAESSYSLFTRVSRRGNLILFGSLRSSGRGAVPLFVLKKSVTQKATPWFPEDNSLRNAIAAGLTAFQSMGGV